MRKTLLVLTPVAYLLVALFSCKKSDTITSQGLGGTWTYLGTTGQTQTTADEGSGITMVANTNFITKNNMGAFTFNTDSVVISGLGYSVDTTVLAYFYFNGAVYDSATAPVSYTIPPTGTSAKFSTVGSDSLYFPHGGIITALDSSFKGQGCHYVIKGDSLTLFTEGVDSSADGVTKMQATISLKRQK